MGGDKHQLTKWTIEVERSGGCDVLWLHCVGDAAACTASALAIAAPQGTNRMAASVIGWCGSTFARSGRVTAMGTTTVTLDIMRHALQYDGETIMVYCVGCGDHHRATLGVDEQCAKCGKMFRYIDDVECTK